MPAPIPTAPLARLFRTFDAMVVLLRRCRNGSAAGFSELSRAWWPPTLAALDVGSPLRKKLGRSLFASPTAVRACPPPLPKIKRQDEITCRRPDTLVLTHRVSKNHGPTEDVTGWAGCKLLAASKLTVDLCVNVLVRPMRISPRQSGATRPCSVPLRGVQGKTWPTVQLRRLRTYCSLQRAGRVESLVLPGRFIIAVHRAFVSGCERSGIV